MPSIALPVSLRGQLLSGTRTIAFSPVSLFAANEPGVWFDPSDLTTLFQDPAGTTPVTAPGQTVGLMLDKSRGLVLGPELVDTANTAAGWFTYGANTVVQEGDAVKVTYVDNGQGAGVYMTAAGGLNTNLTIGKTYLFTCQVKASGGTVSVAPFFFNGSSTGAGSTAVSATDYTTVTFRLLEYTGGAPFVRLETPVGTTGWIRNISVKELPGNHATQATTASQPIYGIVPAGGRRNLLLQTEQFDTASWVKQSVTVPVTQYLAPDGTTTADLLYPTSTGSSRSIYQTVNAGNTVSVYAKAGGISHLWFIDKSGSSIAAWFNLSTGVKGTVIAGYTHDMVAVGTDGWYRCTLRANTGTFVYGQIGLSDADNSVTATTSGTSGILIWGAQLEAGTTATPYQRVTTQYDVTEAGVASLGYLFFDGSGDFMSTGTITPGTDKAQVFAGVRKLTDATNSALIEMSSDVNVNSGVIGVFNGFPSTGNYQFFSKGTGTVGGQAFFLAAAPITSVLTGLGDISGDTATLRLNGTQVAQGTADQGTGNFLAYPLYIGRRAGTSLPFNGQLFPLIVRFGPNLTTARIQSTEIWVGERTPGIDLTKLFSPLIYTRSGDTILDRANSTIERRAV